MQKGKEHSIKKVRRAFFALFVKTIFSKIWVSGQFYDLLGKYWWCYSTQNFFRNRASVRRFSSNFFLEALEGFFKIFKDQGGRDIGPASPLVKFWQDLSTYEFYKFGTDMTRGRG